MAIANFFEKTAFGLSQLLNQVEYDAYVQLLSSHHIQVRYSDKINTQKEGLAGLNLLTSLLARLYPNLQFECLEGASPLTHELKRLAQSINPLIDLSSGEPPTIIINVGKVQIANAGCPEFYIGSDEWIGCFSTTTVQSCQNSANPFGAGFAACIAAANIFRTVFKEQLPYTAIDGECRFSVFDYSINDKAQQGPPLNSIELQRIAFVGLGAIGNGAVWALKQMDLTGTVMLIDQEEVNLSNLQRYVLCTQRDISQPKVGVMQAHLQNEKLQVLSYKTTWDEFLHQSGQWDIPILAVGVDSAQARIHVQASLPKEIINAWTQMEQLGISRHHDFIHQACLACLYLPSQQRKSLSEEIAENLNLAGFERSVIRRYLADHLPIDQSLIDLIATENNISQEQLSPYLGKSMEVFHSEVVCGGIFMRLTGTVAKQETIYVPSAFESALAGIFLAAEIVVAAGNLRTKAIENVTKINLMRPLLYKVTERAEKNNRCLCQDPVFQSVYKQKWMT